jgi:hypothetical protein
MAQLLTAKKQYYAKRVLYDILTTAGLTLKPIINSFSGEPVPAYLESYDYECGRIASELVNRGFSNTDSSISTLYRHGYFVIDYNYPYGVYCQGKRWSHTRQKAISKVFANEEEFALGIVFVAKAMGLFWDDTALSVHEKSFFEQTKLGAAVVQVGAYLSQQSLTNNNAPKAPAKTRTNTPKAAGAAPQNGYKSSGPQSSKARDLKGTAGNKEVLTGIIYKIEGINAKSAKNKAKLYIKPLESSGAKGSTNKVMMGSANGYTDCVCHFTDHSAADHFMMEWAKANSTQTQFTNVQVVRKHADPNGYFLIGTEYGDCYISAVKLNEQLEEDFSQETPEERQARIDQLAAEGYQPNNPQTFDENFNNYDI